MRTETEEVGPQEGFNVHITGTGSGNWNWKTSRSDKAGSEGAPGDPSDGLVRSQPDWKPQKPDVQATRSAAPGGIMKGLTGLAVALGVSLCIGLTGCASVGVAHAADRPMQQQSLSYEVGKQVHDTGQQVKQAAQPAVERGKQVGQQIGETGKKVGQEIGKAGKQFGQEVGKHGKEFGLGVAREAKDFWKGLTGK